MDDIEIVRRALRSSLVSSAPEKLAALDRIEARLKAAEAAVVRELPTASECEGQIRDAEYVIANADEYAPEVVAQARRSRRRWQRYLDLAESHMEASVAELEAEAHRRSMEYDGEKAMAAHFEAEVAFVRALAEQLAEALRSCHANPNSPHGERWEAARDEALAAYDAYAQKGKT